VLSTALTAARLVARDGRVPKPLRALVLVGLLPIPGPVDEAILIVAVPLFFLFARVPLREAWRRAKTGEGGGGSGVGTAPREG